MGSLFIAQAASQNRELSGTNARARAAAVADHLSEVRLFSTCGKKELRAIAKTAKVMMVAPGTSLIREGDDGNTMFVVLTGTARVSRGGRKLATVGPGDAFGELALLSPGPRTATVTAADEMEVVIISRKQLSKLLDDAPGFAKKLLESLADTVRELDKKIV